MNPLLFLLLPVGILCLVLACIAYRQPRVADRVAFWQQSVAGMDENADRFFAQVYQRLRGGLELRGVSLSGLEFGPQVLFETRSVFSQRPRYLCARYRHLTYYLYVSPTPSGFFLSSSLFSKHVKGEGESRITGFAAHKYFLQRTLFQYDAALMFQEAMHAVVLEVLDSYIAEKQLKPLEAYERRPVYHAFYRSSLPPIPAPLLDPASIEALTSLLASSQIPSGTIASGLTSPGAALTKPASAAAPNIITPDANIPNASVQTAGVLGAAV